MLDSLSEEMQLVISVIGIAVLFVLVLWNSKRNKNKLYDRDQRDFRKNYFKKKKR